ncbi:hypothetical protein [Pseudoalteromonas rubra]|nr:hypothetical protein [Pseudoalteromonas rubra]
MAGALVLSGSAASRVCRAENTTAYLVPKASTALKLFYQSRSRLDYANG